MSQITFKDGLPAFEEYKNFQIILNEDEENPFHTLQSLDDEELLFTIVDPFIIKPDYDFVLSDSTVEKLAIEDPKDVAVYAVVTIPDDNHQNITVNLLGPVIINTKNSLAKQIVLNETEYPTKHKIIADGE